MLTRNHIFHSKNILLEFAQNENLLNKPNTLIQIFCGNPSISYIKNIQKSVGSIFPQAHIIGSTTDGEISDFGVFGEHTIVSISIFEATSIAVYASSLSDPYECGKEIASKIKQENTKAIITFAEAMSINGEEYIKGIYSVVGKNIPISGGLAGDNGKLLQTYVFDKENIFSKGAIGVALNSDSLKVYSDYSFGWHLVGKTYTVTKSDKNRVYSIDELSPTDIHLEYFGKDYFKVFPNIGIEFPLIVEQNGMQIARAPLKKHPDGSIDFAGNVEEGSKVGLGIANIDEMLIKSKTFSAKKIGIHPESIFIYSCMARRRFLGKAAVKEITPFKKNAPSVCGFFTYGEFYSNSSNAFLMNETMTILALSENQSRKRPYIKNTKIFSDEITPNENGKDTLKAMSKVVEKVISDLSHSNKELKREIKKSSAIVTEQEKMLIEQSKKATLGDMISMIAHQWRQPIATIGIIASSLNVDLKFGDIDSEFLQKELDTINEQVMFLSKTIDDFKNFFSDGKKLEYFTIADAFVQAENIVKKSFDSHGISIKKSNLHIQAHGSSSELSQMFLNLLSNSKDAIIHNRIKNGCVEITVAENDDYVEIIFKDNGGGFSPEYLEHMFKPYFSTKGDKGTGLGLYISKLIIEKKFKGFFDAHNENEGAYFRVKLSKNLEDGNIAK